MRSLSRLPLPLALIVAAAPLTLSAQSARPTGAWCLDVAHSDSAPPRPGANWASPAPTAPPDAEAGGRREGGEGNGGYGGGGGGGYGGGRRRPGRDLSDKDLERVAQTMGLLRAAPTRLVLGPRDTLRLTGPDGEEMVLRVNGKTHRTSVPEGGDVETDAEWHGSDLIIERRVKGGGRVRETYSRGLEATRLLAYVEVLGLFQPVNLRRQYQMVDGACPTTE